MAEYINHLLENENILEEITENNKAEKQRRSNDLAREQKKLNQIRQDIAVLEEHIPNAMTGTYDISLKELMDNIRKQKSKEQEQSAVVQQKESDLQASTITSKDWEEIKGNIPSWHEVFLYADTPTKRVLVNKLIERIDITRERIVIRFKISLDEFLPQSPMDNNGVVSK